MYSNRSVRASIPKKFTAVGIGSHIATSHILSHFAISPNTKLTLRRDNLTNPILLSLIPHLLQIKQRITLHLFYGGIKSGTERHLGQCVGRVDLAIFETVGRGTLDHGLFGADGGIVGWWGEAAAFGECWFCHGCFRLLLIVQR